MLISGTAMAQGFSWTEKPVFCADSKVMLEWLKAANYTPVGRSWMADEGGQVAGIVWLAVNADNELMVIEQFDTFACIVSASKGLELIKKPTI